MTDKRLFQVTFQSYLADKIIEIPSKEINIHPNILINLLKALE